MAIIEFVNEQTRRTVLAMVCPTEEQRKFKRIAYLQKNGLIHPDIAVPKNIDMRAYW